MVWTSPPVDLKRGEVMAAEECLRPLAHRLDVERTRNVPDIAMLEGRDERAVRDPIPVGLRDRVEAGMKLRTGIFDRDDAHVDGQDGVQRALQRRDVVRGARTDARHLPERMHAGVGSARTMHRQRTTLERRQRLLEQPLNRHAFGLTLPANVVRSVVLDGQLQRAHAFSVAKAVTADVTSVR